MNQTMYDLIPLVSYVCEDPYLDYLKEGKQFLQDYVEMAKIVETDLIKRIMIKRAIEYVPHLDGYEHPVYLDRVMAAEFKLKNRYETPSECLTIFSQVFFNFRGKFYALKNKGEQFFRSYIKGEESYDCGGPMRDIISNMCAELMSGVLPLLVPSANNAANIEVNIDCVRLNPNVTEPHVL